MKPVSRLAQKSACPDENALGAFVQGQTAETRRLELEAHLEGCAECASVVALLGQAFQSRAALGLDSGVTVSGAARAQAAADPATDSGARLREPLGGQPAELVLGQALASGGPSAFGRYQVKHGLGAGGMGLVFSAWDPALERHVALKVLRPELASTEAARQRILAEARAVASLKHSNVVPVFDVGTEGDRIFIAMEQVDGVTFDAWLRLAQPSAERRLEVLVAAGRGLAAAHAQGLVHRDFKPQNLLVAAADRALVTDFGLAVSESAARTPEVAGTPAYMAPEQLHGSASPASDQYSFALCVYEAFYGELPPRTQQVIPAVKRGVPDWLRPILGRALSHEPGQRYPDLDALLSDLEGGGGVTASAHITTNALLLCAWTLLHAVWLVILVYTGLRLAQNPELLDEDAYEPEYNLPETSDWFASSQAQLGLAFSDSAFDIQRPAADTSLNASDWLLIAVLLYAVTWIPLGLVWAPLNAAGLWLRKPWARVSTLGYAGLTAFSVVGLPYALYAFYSLTRPGVVQLFSGGATRQEQREARAGSIVQGQVHLTINRLAQGGMLLFHLGLVVFSVELIAFAEEPGSPGTPALVYLGALWNLLACPWTLLNIWGLGRRQPWSRVSSLLYAGCSLLTGVGTPYGIYALISLNLPSVRQRRAG